MLGFFVHCRSGGFRRLLIAVFAMTDCDHINRIDDRMLWIAPFGVMERLRGAGFFGNCRSGRHLAPHGHLLVR